MEQRCPVRYGAAQLRGGPFVVGAAETIERFKQENSALFGGYASQTGYMLPNYIYIGGGAATSADSTLLYAGTGYISPLRQHIHSTSSRRTFPSSNTLCRTAYSQADDTRSSFCASPPPPSPPPPSLATTYTIPAAYSGAYTPPTYLTNPYLFTPAVVSVCARDAAPVAYTPAAIPAVGFSAHSRPATPQQKSNTIDLSDIALRAFYFEGICGKGVVTPMSSTVLQ